MAAPETPDPKSEAKSSADRYQIFEKIALDRLRGSADLSKPASFLPLPVRLTAATAIGITALGVVWACFAKVPIQAYGIASFSPESQVSSVQAEIAGILRYQVSGVGLDRLSPRIRRQNEAISAYWGENWAENQTSHQRLNALVQASVNYEEGQRLLLRESGIAGRELIDNLSQSQSDFEKLYFKPNTVIARIFSPLASAELEATRVSASSKLRVDQLLAKDRRRRAEDYGSMTTLIADQAERQRMELKDREKLFVRLQKLWDKGYISTAQLLGEQASINGLRSQILQMDREKKNNDFTATDQVFEARRAANSSLDATTQLEKEFSSYLKKTYVFAPGTGMYIVSRDSRNEAMVNPGDELLTYTIEKPTLPRAVSVFVDAATSEQIQSGMDVLVTPKGISRAQYGGMPGVVLGVGKNPLSTEGVASFAGGRNLAASIQQQYGSGLYLVRVRLVQSEPAYCQQMASLRCYRWSTKRRPPFPVRLGTLADAQINVEYRRPIEFVMPALRRALGLVVDTR